MKLDFRQWLENVVRWLGLFPLPRKHFDIKAAYAEIDAFREACEHPIEMRDITCMQCGETLWNISAEYDKPFFTTASNRTTEVTLRI